jgi:hypothetical protein
VGNFAVSQALSVRVSIPQTRLLSWTLVEQMLWYPASPTQEVLLVLGEVELRSHGELLLQQLQVVYIACVGVQE